MSKIDHFIEVSGANSNIRRDFDSLKHNLPDLSKDLEIATIQVKEALANAGFSYVADSFTIQDMLQRKGGNCLGLPLLIGCLLDQAGHSPRFKLVTRPQDVVDRLEADFYDRTIEETGYGCTQLADREEFPIYRFVPLEHLVLDVNGKLMEATSREHHFVVSSESSRDVSFEQVLSQVYKDRALGAIANGQAEEARDLANRGLELWRGNRQLFSVIAGLSTDAFDDESYESAVRNFQRLDGEDSLTNLQRYYFTEDPAFLEKALSQYPSFAEAITARARNLVRENSQEAKFLFSVASQLYANSQHLDLGSFYVANADELSRLFGPEKVLRKLETHRDEKWGDFYYHQAMFRLSGDETHLYEAEEAVTTPYQELSFLNSSEGVLLDTSDGERELDSRFGDSKLYQNAKKDLKREELEVY